MTSDEVGLGREDRLPTRDLSSTSEMVHARDWTMVGAVDQASATEQLDERRIFELVYRQMRALCPRAGTDLDDLVQDAAEQVLRSLDSFEGRSKLSTWTYQVCYRTLLKRQRSYARWIKRFSFTRTGELPEPREAPHDGDEPERRERIGRLRVALDQLSPKRRAVVVMHDLEGMKSEEIAEVVGARLGTVRSRLRDGRKDLLRLLSDDPYFGSGVPSSLHERKTQENDHE